MSYTRCVQLNACAHLNSNRYKARMGIFRAHYSNTGTDLRYLFVTPKHFSCTNWELKSNIFNLETSSQIFVARFRVTSVAARVVLQSGAPLRWVTEWTSSVLMRGPAKGDWKSCSSGTCSPPIVVTCFGRSGFPCISKQKFISASWHLIACSLHLCWIIVFIARDRQQSAMVMVHVN